MGSRHIVIILIIISVSLITIPAYAESDVVIYQVEPYPIDVENGWVKLYNPSDNSVDLSGWEIKSTKGKLNTYPLSGSIKACDFKKITLESQFDNDYGLIEYGALILYDNNGKIVQLTPNIDYFGWINPDVSLSCYKPETPEPVYVSPMTQAIIEQEPVTMGFYSNESYEFSFEISKDWVYWENLLLPDGITTSQVVFVPSVVTYESMKESGVQVGLSALYSGLPFPIESPIISVTFENILESKIPRMNIQEIEKYEREFVITNIPSAKIIDLDVKSTSWGWVASGKITFSVGQSQLISETNTYYFKDRESYAVSYSAYEDIYDQFKPDFDHVIDTLVIKSISVPEFQEIALMVLGGSIALVVIFARKFTKFVTKSENS